MYRWRVGGCEGPQEIQGPLYGRLSIGNGFRGVNDLKQVAFGNTLSAFRQKNVVNRHASKFEDAAATRSEESGLAVRWGAAIDMPRHAVGMPSQLGVGCVLIEGLLAEKGLLLR